LGAAIYYFFGLEYRKSKIFKRKDLNSYKLIERWNDQLFIKESKLEKYEQIFLEDRIRIVRLRENNQLAPLTLQNDLKVIYNGENTFKSIFKDVDRAAHHIHLEYFAFNDDITGDQFIDHLIAVG
jgi:cardiolipin synthase